MTYTRKRRKGLASFAQIRAAMKEMTEAADKRMKEMAEAAAKRQEEADKRMKEMAEAADKRQEEWEQRQKEADKRKEELDKCMKEMSLNLGGIGNNNGAFAEEVFGNSLEETKTFAGIHFDEVKRNMKSKQGGVEDEFDVVMYNDNAVVLIEVKYTALTKHLDNMVAKKVPNFRTLFPYYAKHKVYLGIGSLSFDSYVISLAKALGIGLLKQKGDTIEADTSYARAY